MPTFKITLAYDGTNYVGWQRQAAGTSIQGLIEDALRDWMAGRCARHRRRPDGCRGTCPRPGRLVFARADDRAECADAGAQRTAARRRPGRHRRDAVTRLPRASNTATRRPTAIGSATPLSSARSSVSTPGTSPGPLDVDAMDAAARCARGPHDFAAFPAVGGPAAHAPNGRSHPIAE